MDLDSPPVHPLVDCAQRIHDALDELAVVDPIYLRASEKRDALLALGRAAARLEAARLAVLAASADVAELTAARSPGEWAAHELGLSPAQGRRDQALADALDQRYPALARGLALGEVQRPQAEVIARSLDDLPSDLDPDARGRAERHLVGLAVDFAPRELRELGARILTVVAPELADDHERRRLEDADARAAAETRATLRRRGDGTSDFRARIGDLFAARLKTYLEALTHPRHPNQRDPEHTRAASPDDRRTYAQRLGHAFEAFLEATDPDRLPMHGGDATTLVVTVDWDDLKNDTGHATLPDGTEVSPGQARRLACQAGWMPVVMGGPSVVLDVGRLRRLFTRLLRRALVARDTTCRAVGCDHPATWCEAHHKVPWSHGGATRIDDGVMLCAFHHHRAHDPRYEVTYHPDGDVAFHRRI